MIKMLYVAYRAPYPPDKGERIRAYHQICYLADHTELHLVFPTLKGIPEADWQALTKLCSSVHCSFDSTIAVKARELRRFLSGDPIGAGTFNSKNLRDLIRQIVDQQHIDVILLSSIFLAEISFDYPNTKKVLDLIDMYSIIRSREAEISTQPRRWLLQADARRMASFERQTVNAQDAVVVSSRSESLLFGEQFPNQPVSVVGNGVDLDYFKPPISRIQADICAQPNFVFTGTMNYSPNIDAVVHFVKFIFPLVRQRLPGATFTIVGRDPTAAVVALAKEVDVDVTGSVADVRPYLARATAAIAPMLFGQGIQNKVLEAMAMGVPVVCTQRAVAGMEGLDKFSVRVAVTDRAFADELIGLSQNGERRAQCAAAARAFVEKFHRWDAHGSELLRVLRAL